MRYIDLRFTYLLTYLLTYLRRRITQRLDPSTGRAGISSVVFCTTCNGLEFVALYECSVIFDS